MYQSELNDGSNIAAIPYNKEITSLPRVMSRDFASLKNTIDKLCLVFP